MLSFPAYVQTNYSCEQLNSVLLPLIDACQQIAEQLHLGALANDLGSIGSTNIQGETQKAFDVFANDLLKEKLLEIPQVAGIASEEEDLPVKGHEKGQFLVVFDPLDGSSNIDVNVSVGTIFSILRCPEGLNGGQAEAYLQSGREQVAAGYVLYGPAASLNLTVGKGVQQFTLKPHAGFYLNKETMSIPETTKEFSINMSNERHWEAPMQQYIRDLVAGEDGVREKNYNMRWIASMVADVHRVLTRGGIFCYPWDKRQPEKPGKLRLLYEGNPMALLVEQAGGRASTAYCPLLDVKPTDIHQRVSVALGSSQEIHTLVEYHEPHKGSQADTLNQ